MQRQFKLHPSRRLTAAIVSAVLVCLVVVSLLPVHWGGQVLLMLACAAWGVQALRLHARLSLPQACRVLRLEAAPEVTLIQNDGQHLAGTMGGGSVILPWLVLLDIRLAGKRRRSVVLCVDSLDAQSLRRLRVLLKWQASAPA